MTTFREALENVASGFPKGSENPSRFFFKSCKHTSKNHYPVFHEGS